MIRLINALKHILWDVLIVLAADKPNKTTPKRTGSNPAASTVVSRKPKKQRQKNTLSTLFLRPSFVLTLVVAVLSLFILYITYKSATIGASMGFLMIVLTIFGAGVSYEVISRRRWEAALSVYFRNMEKRVDQLSDSHDQELSRLKLALSALIDERQDEAFQEEISKLEELNIQRDTEKSTLHHLMAQNLSDYEETELEPEFNDEDVTPYETVLPSFDNDETQKKALNTPNADAALNQAMFASSPVPDDVIISAIKRDRMDVFSQPVVKLPSRTTIGYECFARAKGLHDKFIHAKNYAQTVGAENLWPTIDNFLLMRVIQYIRKSENHVENMVYFLNMDEDTFNDEDFILDMIEYLSDSPSIARCLVLEFSQDAFYNLQKNHKNLLQGLKTAGCKFSLDHVDDLTLKAQDLFSKNIRYIKLDTEFVQDTATSRIGLVALNTLKKDLYRNGIDLIIQKIEQDDALLQLLDYNIDYGQGYLFGVPEKMSLKKVA